jgi:Fe-S-cluster containining protein
VLLCRTLTRIYQEKAKTVVKKSAKTGSGSLSRRLPFPQDEERLPWLAALLDSYAITDTGVAIAVRDAEKKQKKKLACGKDCDVCCHQPDIPLYPHELEGLRWYVAEKLEPPTRERVLKQCTAHTQGSPCPFLVEHACAVHPMRPVACRQYNVFTTPCAPGEDPYYTRRDDVLVPLSDYRDRAFAAVARYYGMEKERDNEKVVRSIKGMIMNLQEYDWTRVAASAQGIRSEMDRTGPPATDPPLCGTSRNNE